MSTDDLINAVRNASTLDAWARAYLAARRACLQDDRMGELLDAADSAEDRLDQPAPSMSPECAALFG